MEPPKGPRGKQAHHQDPRTGCDNLIRGVKIEIADACNEKVREDEIGKSPKNVGGRRGKALTGRLGKWTLESSTHHSTDEVRDGIGEDGAAEQVGRVVKPVQDCALLSSRSLILCVVGVSAIRGLRCAGGADVSLHGNRSVRLEDDVPAALMNVGAR